MATTNDNKIFGISDIMNYPDLNSNTKFVVVPLDSYRDYEINMMVLPFKKRKNYKGTMINCNGTQTRVKWTGNCFMAYVAGEGFVEVISDDTLIKKLYSIEEKLLLAPTLYKLYISNNKSHLSNYVGKKIVSNHTGNSTGKARKVIATKHKITRRA